MDETRTLSSHEILSTLALHADHLRALGASKIGLFGSRGRDEANATSDIDLVVTLVRPSFDDYMDIKLYLEEIFNAPIDLVLETSLRPELSTRILREVVYVEGL